MTHFNAYNGTFIFRSLDKYLEYVKYKRSKDSNEDIQPNDLPTVLKRSEEIIRAFHNELVRLRKQNKPEFNNKKQGGQNAKLFNSIPTEELERSKD